MNRFFIRFLLVIVVLIPVMLPQVATAYGPHLGPCRVSFRFGISGKTHRHEMKILECAANRWSVAGGYLYAHGIAHRESGADMWYGAINTSSGACGVFQHIQSFWFGRVDKYLNPKWFGRDGKGGWTHKNIINCTNARANILVAIEMAHFGGWGPWGG